MEREARGMRVRRVFVCVCETRLLAAAQEIPVHFGNTSETACRMLCAFVFVSVRGNNEHDYT